MKKQLTLFRTMGRGKIDKLTTDKYVIKRNNGRLLAIAEKSGKKYVRFVKAEDIM